MALLLPEFVDVVRLLLDLTNQLTNEFRGDAKASCCLLVVEILNTYSLPQFLDNFYGQLSSRHRFAPITVGCASGTGASNDALLDPDGS